MRTLKNILYSLLAAATLFSCTDEEIIKQNEVNVEEGIPVTLKLSYNTLHKVEVKGRAAEDGVAPAAVDADYNYGLQIFVFNANSGALTGYKNLSADEFNYSETIPQSVEIETLTGKSYIYAVANYNTTNYDAKELLALMAADGDNNEKVKGITLSQFQSWVFERTSESLSLPDKGDNEEKILMSGKYQDETNGTRNANDDGSCTIGLTNNQDVVIYNAQGALDNEPIIYLKRVLAKVKFNVSLAERKGYTLSTNGLALQDNNQTDVVTFNPIRYEIHNIPKQGRLNFYTPGEERETTEASDENISDEYVYQGTFSTVDAHEGSLTFDFYLPENLQNSKNDCTDWNSREKNTYTNGVKSFDNAPDKGTYVVLYGEYHDRKDKIVGDAIYTIHLGDMATSMSNFDVERNCSYTYNVKIKNVADISVEAIKNEDQPGTEGVVIDYKTGRAYTLDSHYEAVLLQVDKANEYSFVIQAYDKDTKKLSLHDLVKIPSKNFAETFYQQPTDWETVKAKFYEQIKDLDVNWLSFALLEDIKNNVQDEQTGNNQILPSDAYRNAISDMAYINNAQTEVEMTKGGYIPFLTYTRTRKNNTDCLMSFEEFFYYLANDDNWTTKDANDNDNTPTKTFVCFVDEYYYSDNQYAIEQGYDANSNFTYTDKGHRTDNDIVKPVMTWDQYTNADPRAFYMIRQRYTSQDEKSIHMEVFYSLYQHSIQTFYNTAKANDIMAYGCEYINNEEYLDTDKNGIFDIQENNNKQPNTTPDAPDGVGNQVYDYWNGRANTTKDIAANYNNDNTNWGVILGGNVTHAQPLLRWAFVDRNRDLDRDGKIDNNEIRWYTPTIPQYLGFWVGEDVVEPGARLYRESYWDINLNGNDIAEEDYRHYYSSSASLRSFWAEEGFTCNTFENNGTSRPRFLRCIRNLGANGSNDALTAPAPYYTRTNLEFDLSNMNTYALRTGEMLMNTELDAHAEREPNNKARVKFELAKGRVGQTIQNAGQDNEALVGDPTAFTIMQITNNLAPNGQQNYQVHTQYWQTAEDRGYWRIPNQKEFSLICMESSKVDNLAKAANGNYREDGMVSYLQEYPNCLLANEFHIVQTTTGWPFQQITTYTVTPTEYNNQPGGQERFDACRTHCTRDDYRQGYHMRRRGDYTLMLSMLNNQNGAIYYIRPVRDK